MPEDEKSKDEEPKEDAEEEKKPEGDNTPPPPQPSHDLGEKIDKVSHTVEAQVGMFEGLFTMPMIVVGVLLGLLLQFLGATLLNFNFHLDVSQVISNFGRLVVLVVLIGGALLNNKIDPYVRFGMLFLAAFVAGFNQIVYT